MLGKDYKYYQPEEYYDDGTNIGWCGVPEGMFSFQAFPSEEECIAWLENNGYEPGDFTIHEYSNDDIEEVEIIDSDGNIIPAIEDYTDDELFDCMMAKILEMNHDIKAFEDKKREDESQQEYEDRLYGTAHAIVMNEIARMEESNCYNFAGYGGNSDVEWYDGVREDLIREVMKEMVSKD